MTEPYYLFENKARYILESIRWMTWRLPTVLWGERDMSGRRDTEYYEYLRYIDSSKIQRKVGRSFFSASLETTNYVFDAAARELQNLASISRD